MKKRLRPRDNVDDNLDSMFKKIYTPMCEAHLLEHQFQLMPYECTAACVKKRIQASRYVMEPEEMVIWFSLGPILGGEKPRCGWCGKNMRPSKTRRVTSDHQS